MVKNALKNIFKVSLALSSVLLLFVFFSSESITFSVPNSVSEFSKFMDEQKTFEIVPTQTENGYSQSLDYEAYSRLFLVDAVQVALYIQKYDTLEMAQSTYDILKHQNVNKMTFDIDGNSYIRFKVGDMNYCAWRNKETVIVMRSSNKESLQILKNFIVKQTI